MGSLGWVNPIRWGSFGKKGGRNGWWVGNIICLFRKHFCLSSDCFVFWMACFFLLVSYGRKALWILFWYSLLSSQFFVFSRVIFCLCVCLGLQVVHSGFSTFLLIADCPFVRAVRYGLAGSLQQVTWVFSCGVLRPQHSFPWIAWQGDLNLDKWDGRLGQADQRKKVAPSCMLKGALTAISDQARPWV